ncbi:DNA glycosylase AlkZ-like family protein [Nonomuraea antimicrobica]
MPASEEAEQVTWSQVLSWRLVQQHLAPRMPSGGVADVASALCGLHAQLTSSAELSAVARLRNPREHELEESLWNRRDLVKLWGVRGTLHFLPAAELDEWLSVFGTFGNYGMGKPDVRRLVDMVGRALYGRHLTRVELAREVDRLCGSAEYGRLLTESWGTALKPASFSGRLCFAPGRVRPSASPTPAPGWEPTRRPYPRTTPARRWPAARSPCTAPPAWKTSPAGWAPARAGRSSCSPRWGRRRSR